MKNTRVNLLSKFLISYLLVLFFPIVIFLGYYYLYSTKLVEEKEMDWNDHIIGQFMNSMDIFTSYVYDLPAELIANREIKLYMTDESDYQRIIVANEMRKYNATDAFIYNTMLYVKNVGYFFAKTGSVYHIEDFRKKGVGYVGYAYEDWPVEEMVSELNALTEPRIRPVEEVIVPGNNRLRMLTFMLPMPLGGENSPGALLIMVEEQTIARLMRSLSEAYTGHFFIYDQNGQLLFASEQEAYNSPTLSSLVAQRQLASGTNGSSIVQMDGERMIISQTVSDKNGWRYVSVMPLEDTLHDIRTLQRNTLLLLVCVLIIELVIISISIRSNVHPIKRLVQSALDVFDLHKPDKLNEIETIRYALDHLSAANSTLDERVKLSMPVMRDNLLNQMVSGHYTDWKLFTQEAAAYGIHFSHPLASVAVINCRTGDEKMSGIAEWLREQEHKLPPQINGYFFKSVYQHEWLFVCSHTDDVQLERILMKIRTMLAEQLAVQTMIGIGSPQPAHTPEAYHHSYLQALRAAEHLRMHSEPGILKFDDMSATRVSLLSYNGELLQSLELAILKSEVEAIRAILKRILESMASGGLAPHAVKAFYLNTIGIIIAGLQRFQSDDQNLLALTTAAVDNRYSLKQMMTILEDSCNKLCELIQGTIPEVRAASAESIIAYIEEQGTSPDFSLQMIADHFGMTMSNFSYHFKKTFGQNFKEYVDKFRMQRAIQLLRTTDGPLETVARESGYTNTSSFIRTFKKMVGTTPGQFRETNRGLD